MTHKLYREFCCFASKLTLSVVLVAVGQLSWAAGNIDPEHKYACSENAGWVNFRPTGGGVAVRGTGLSGYAWAENMGWIKLGSGDGPYGNTGPSDWGVNVQIVGGVKNLSGFSWSETCGWINFNPTYSQVTIDPVTGLFDGYAWSENVGWIHFQNASPAYDVKMSNETLPNIDTSNSYAFAENAGWLNFNPVDGGVAVTTAGLSGYAWAENAGWINFSPTHSQVTIDSLTGRFDGYAWSENVGWIHFRNSGPTYNVRITDYLVPRGTLLIVQ